MGITVHGMQRMIERGIDADRVLEAIENPTFSLAGNSDREVMLVDEYQGLVLILNSRFLIDGQVRLVSAYFIEFGDEVAYYRGGRNGKNPLLVSYE